MQGAGSEVTELVAGLQVNLTHRVAGKVGDRLGEMRRFWVPAKSVRGRN